MRELGPTSRALVAAARDGMSPDPATAARVRAKLAVALGATTTLGASTVATSTPATSAPTFAVAQPIARMSLVHKLAIVIGVAATIGIVAGIARMHDRASTTSAPALSAPLLDDELRSDRVVAPQQPPPAEQRSVTPAAATTPDHRAPATLAREVELVDRAMTELRLGNPDAALTIVATFERETFGRGQLAEDIAAISIEARCARGDDATDAIAGFDHRWPSSAQRTRITAACNR